MISKPRHNVLVFFACGIARAEQVDEATQEHVHSWLGDKKYAGMEYMNNNTEKRLDPRLLMPGLKKYRFVCY